ncbi:LHFPL tetraspan subfamily member 7 protein [Natator depressus]|uniref:LHFPL tetraspan subfamily member 7 protein n=1 Tax=Natator depressus TaxID=27790 RepID=UPI003EBE128A
MSLIPKLGSQDLQWHHIWAIFSLALACISNFSLRSPAWFRNKTTSSGVFTHCYWSSKAVIGTILGLLIFPCSLDSAFANEIGGYSSTDNAGKRKLGWGYTVAILDVLLPCLLPVIGRYNLNEVKSKVFFSPATESRILVVEDE